MIRKPIFPNHFLSRSHSVAGAKQWVIPKSGDVIISIVGGGRGLNGDGEYTFEMYDFRERDIHGYLSKDEINEHLRRHPLYKPKGNSGRHKSVSIARIFTKTYIYI